MNKKKLAGFVTLGVGGAVGIVGVAMGISALNEDAALKNECPAPKYAPGHPCVSSDFKGR